jgi:CheY-like chemotaxis protein
VAAIAEGAPHCRARILLVDDDSDVREVAAAMLDEAGYEVVEAGSGAAALECLDREGARIGLIIADIAMPGMSGLELAQTARRHWPNLPVLHITGFVGAEISTGETEVEHLLRKPFRTAELIAKVAAMLETAGERP